MPPVPETDHRSALDRAMVWSAFSAGVAWPVVLVARGAFNQSFTGEVVAASTIPVLMLLIVAGYIAARVGGPLRRRRAAALGAIGAIVLALQMLWNALLGSRLLDPTGLGAIAPHGGPLAFVLLCCVVSIGLGLNLRRPTRWFNPQSAAQRRLAITATLTFVLAATTVARNSPAASLCVSMLAALAIVLCAVTFVSAAPTVAMNNLAAAALGLACFSPGALQLIARRQPERLVVIDDVTFLSGPVVPTMLWVGLIAASMGILIGAAAALVWRRHPAVFAVPSSVRLFAPCLLALGYLLRVAALLTVNHARRDAGDPFFYHATANLLAHGRGFIEPVTWVAFGDQTPSALHGPAFPAVLALSSRLGGTGYFDQQMASIVLGLPQIAAAIMLGHLLLGRRAALIAGFLVVVYPNIWITDGTLFVEGLMASFTTFATWCAYKWRADPRQRWMIALGVLIGLAALTRGEALLMVPLLLLPLVISSRQLARRDRTRHALLGVVACVATLAPWMIYNAPRFEVFVPLSTNSNEVLFYANCDEAYSGPLIGFWSFACQTRHRELYGEPPGDQAEKAVYWRQQAIEYATEHWEELPEVIAARVGRQWELFRPSQNVDLAFVELRPRVWVQAGQRMYYALMALAVAGTWALRRRRIVSWPMWNQALAVTITAAYAYGTLRFRAPFEPILCVLAACGLVGLHDLYRVRRQRQLPIPEIIDDAACATDLATPTL